MRLALVKSTVISLYSATPDELAARLTILGESQYRIKAVTRTSPFMQADQGLAVADYVIVSEMEMPTPEEEEAVRIVSRISETSQRAVTYAIKPADGANSCCISARFHCPTCEGFVELRTTDGLMSQSGKCGCKNVIWGIEAVPKRVRPVPPRPSPKSSWG